MSDQLQVWHCLEGSGPVQSLTGLSSSPCELKFRLRGVRWHTWNRALPSGPLLAETSGVVDILALSPGLLCTCWGVAATSSVGRDCLTLWELRSPPTKDLWDIPRMGQSGPHVWGCCPFSLLCSVWPAHSPPPLPLAPDSSAFLKLRKLFWTVGASRIWRRAL